MSKIYFHTPAQTEEVSGAELGHALGLCRDIAAGVLNQLVHDSYAEMVRLFPPGSFVANEAARDHGQAAMWPIVREVTRSALHSAHGDERFSDGSHILDTILNTVLVIGSEEMRFVALLAGQCADHGYVEAEDAAWLAGVIWRALKFGLLRLSIDGSDSGWFEVIRLLGSATTPVVTSYSGGQGFPNSHVAHEGGTWSPRRCEACNGTGETPDSGSCDQCDGNGYNDDGWVALSADHRWHLAMAGLRALPRSPRWTASSGTAPRLFGEGRTVLDVVYRVRSS